MKNIRTILNKCSQKSLWLVLCMIMLSTTFLTGCVGGTSIGLNITPKAPNKVEVLLGDLGEDAPVDVKIKLGKLVNNADVLRFKRELQGNYEMSYEEYRLWEKISAILDKETIRQFGEVGYVEENYRENIAPNLDYGKDTMTNLKKILSREDWNSLNKMRNDYFTATENGNNYDVDIELEIKAIINKYKDMDADAVFLNILDDKKQKNFGIFKINQDFDAEYQSGLENGLVDLNAEDQQTLKMVWDLTTDILPKEQFANFRYFKVGGDGELGVVAYVVPLDSEGKVWCMTVDPADISEDGLFPYTVVHEIAHYISLNEKQVDYFNGDFTFYPMYRFADWNLVAKEDSYLQAFYTSFWKDIINDWATNEENPYFYYRHKSQFVTGYSSTECAEDFAESFSAYVLLDKAPTPETQAKLDFFDQYPEFRELKKVILKKIKENKVYVSPEIEPVYDEIQPAA